MTAEKGTTPVTTPPITTKAGFAAIIGAPNAGKSTLTNRLVGAKVSIVTQKVQTTRFPVRGVAMAGDAQIVLVDTPGIFTPTASSTAPWSAPPGGERGTLMSSSTWWTRSPS